jgi:hypothetical protein
MKKVVTILSLLLFLTFRQSSPAILDEPLSVSYFVHAQRPFITGMTGLGWIEDSKRVDPNASAPGLPLYHKSELVNEPVEPHDCYAFLYQYQPNPLLIDRPPPVTDV